MIIVLVINNKLKDFLGYFVCDGLTLFAPSKDVFRPGLVHTVTAVCSSVCNNTTRKQFFIIFNNYKMAYFT